MFETHNKAPVINFSESQIGINQEEHKLEEK
jgi:hypothetical protein